MSALHLIRRAAAVRPALVVAALLGATACEGDNLYRSLPTGSDGSGSLPGAVRDSVPPLEARFLLPLEDALVAAGDSVLVRVAARDDRALDSIVVHGFAPSPGDPSGQAQRFARTVRRYAAADTVAVDTFSVFAHPLGSEPADSAYLVVTAFDRAQQATADTLRIAIASIRGDVLPLANRQDQILDLVSDGSRVYLSNYTRNRVEVIDIASGARSSFRVGSQPWGLALSADRGTLFVANSGGTNISVIDLRGSTLQESEGLRIQTPNVKLFQVPFSRDSVEVVNAAGDTVSISAVSPSQVVELDYSDRPQFIAATAGGELLYSTKPTKSAADGTIRRRLQNGRIELFLDYARRDQSSMLVVVNARDAALVEGDPNRLYVLTAEGTPLIDYIEQIDEELTRLGSETRLEYHVNLDDIGLQDTTFVAVSGDHRAVVFGEGAADPGRIIHFREIASGFLTQVGDTRDLVNNAAERVVGLALNSDGTLGAARGRNAYFFSPALRLQGIGVTGAPSGGLAMHPRHGGYPSVRGPLDPTGVAFVSGVDESGRPYVDVIDAFSFDVRNRIFLNSAITGPLVAIEHGRGASVRIFGVGAAGVVRVDIDEDELRATVRR